MQTTLQTTLQTPLQTTLNRKMHPVQAFAAGTWLVLFAVPTLCLSAAVMVAQAPSYVPPAVTTATTALFSGLANSNGDPARVAVDKAGNVYFIAQTQSGGGPSSLIEIPVSSPPAINNSPVTLITGLGEYNTHAVVVDANGNLWVTVGNANGITVTGGTDYLSMAEIPAVNGLPNTTAITSGGETLAAVDAKHCAAGNTLPCTLPNYWFNTPSGASPGVNGPQIEDFYVDASGNVYYIDVYDNSLGSNQFNIVAVNPVSSPGNATVLYASSNQQQNTSSQLAVGGDGKVYYCDAQGGYEPSQKTPTGNTYVIQSGALVQVGNAPTLTTAEITSCTGISSDIYGNLYIVGVAGNASTSAATSPTQISEVPNEAGTLNFADEFGVASGLTDQVSWGGSLDQWGNYYYANSTNVDQVQVGGFNFGGVAVGKVVNAVSTIPAPTLTVYFNANETVAGNYFPTGSPTSNTIASLLQSFPYSGTKSIGGGGSNWTPGKTGTIVMDFEPVHPGLLKGAYTPRDGSSNLEFTVNLQGVGLGPQPMFLPGIGSQVFSAAATSATNPTAVNLNGPTGIAIDSFGDIFVADTGNAKVVADCLATTSTATGNSFCVSSGYAGAIVELGTSFTAPAGIALDGANSLYVVDSSADSVTCIQSDNFKTSTPITSSTTFGGTALNGPTGIALDGYANMYIADSGNNRIVEAHQYGALGTNDIVLVPSAMKFGGAALKAPSGVAVDAAGDLYIADTGNNRVVEYSALGAATVISTTGVTLNAPIGIVVLPSGSLIVTDTTNQLSLINPAAGTGLAINGNSAMIVGNSNATVGKLVGVAADPWGNLYGVDTTGNQVLELDVSSPATAPAFPVTTALTTSSTTDTTFVYNSGTAPLTFSAAPALDAGDQNFGILGSGTCANGASVPAGTFCTLETEFTPQAVTGLQSGSVTITDNLLPYTLVTSTSNETAAFGTSGAQTINLSGTATATSLGTQTITGFSPPATMVAGQQITLSATGGASGNPVAFSIDPSSACTTCATASGANGVTLTAVSAGTIVVDANQAAGQKNGTSFSAAKQVQKTIVIGNATAAGIPALFMIQNNTGFPAIPGGGVLAGPTAAGTSFGVGNNGYVGVSETYGNYVAIYNLSAGTVTTSGWKISSPGGVTADSKGNLYIAGQYDNLIAKVPFVNGAYAAFTDPGTAPAPAACTGNDTTECLLGPISKTSAIGGVSALNFDSQGDLFLVTDNQGSSQFAIWACTAACLSSGTPAPQLVFQEPASSDPVNAGQLYIGNVAPDPWGNLYFTDSNLLNQAVSSPNNEATYSEVKELPASTGTGFGGVATGFAATPVLVQKYTNGSPGGYDDNLDAITVDKNGTIYYATLYDGVFAIPSTQAGGPMTSSQYAVTTTNTGASGAKALGVDANGDLFEITNSLNETILNPLELPSAQLHGAQVQASATLVDNAFGCSAAPNFVITSNDQQFSGTAGGTCSGISLSGVTTPISGSTYPATLYFQATNGGPQTATLSISDTANGGEGGTNVAGVGQETPQTIAFTSPSAGSTYTYSPTLAISLSVSNGASNNPASFTLDSNCGASTCGAGTFSSTTVTGATSTATLTVTQAGPIQIDANELGGLVNGIYYEPAPQATLQLTIGKAGQTISFAPPNSPVTYAPGLTVPLTATGGASGNLVTFSVDQSCGGASTCGTGTISASALNSGTSVATLTVTGAGPIAIDANQTGNADYLAATQAQQSLVVNQAPQAITFIPLTQPFHYIAGGVTLTIQATGGASDLPIVFQVDSKSAMSGSFSVSTVNGATSTATLTVPAQTATSGSIIVDATQPANTNYSAAQQQQETINVLSPLPTQTITFNNPGTQVASSPLTLAATASSGFPVSYASSTTSVCTATGSVVTFAAVTSTSTCTVTASQPGDNQYFAAAAPVTQSFLVNPAGNSPNMSMNVSLSSLTIQSGTVGLSQISLNSTNNFTGTISFSCSGLPAGYTCTFTPNPVTLPAGSYATTNLSITGSSTASIHRDSQPLFPIATLAVALCLMGFRRRSRLHLIVLVVVSVFGLGLFSGCGGSASTTVSSTTSSVTVTAAASGMSGASAGIKQSVTMSVTVN